MLDLCVLEKKLIGGKEEITAVQRVHKGKNRAMDMVGKERCRLKEHGGRRVEKWANSICC